ncbi:hypothetical protein ACHWQZ_G013947 [Mnemiopsis leidyi]
MFLQTVVLLILDLSNVGEGRYPYDTCNPGLVNEGWVCNEENLCWYGCDKGYCWSQCNGAGAALWDGPEGTCNTEWHMMWDIEWCWLSGENTTCTTNLDCAPHRFNQCGGPCSIA